MQQAREGPPEEIRTFPDHLTWTSDPHGTRYPQGSGANKVLLDTLTQAVQLAAGGQATRHKQLVQLGLLHGLHLRLC